MFWGLLAIPAGEKSFGCVPGMQVGCQGGHEEFSLGTSLH
jgi:hypothetical protein